MPDRIFAGLTIRQLVLLGGDALLIWLLFVAIGRSLHPILFAAVAMPLAAAGLGLATSTPEGMGLDRLATLAGRYVLRPRRHVLAPEGVAFSRGGKSRLRPIQIPVHNLSGEGLLDLSPEGFARVCSASGVNLALRSETEQFALIEALGRFLNSLDGPIQILVASRRIELSTLLEDLNKKATFLQHPSLERAAREHALYLTQLTGRRDMRRRDVLVCFREQRISREEAEVQLHRRVEQASGLLRPVGVSLRELSLEETAALLRASGDAESSRPPVGCDLSSSPIIGAAR